MQSSSVAHHVQAIEWLRPLLTLSTPVSQDHDRKQRLLRPHAPSTHFALLAQAKHLATVRTVPLGRPSRDVFQAHAFQMKPLLLAILFLRQHAFWRWGPQIHVAATHLIVVALNHSPETNAITQAVSRLVGINDIAFIIDLDLANLCLGLAALPRRCLVLTRASGLLLWCSLAPPHGAITTRVGAADDAGRRPPRPLPGSAAAAATLMSSQFRRRRVARGTSGPWTVGSRRGRRLLAHSLAAA